MDELGDPLNTYEEISTYNNYYEFTTDKQGVAKLSKDFITHPWQVEVGGLVNNPRTFEFEEMLSEFTQEERIYRLRCVEAWSMVIPWAGFELASLLQAVDPKPEAQYRQVYLGAAPGADAGPEVALDRLALRRRTALGRGQAPADSDGHRHLRQADAQRQRRSAATGRALEVRLQEHQGHRQDRADRHHAHIDVDGSGAPTSTASTPTSIPPWTIPAGRRRPSDASVNRGRRETLPFNGYEEEVASFYEGMDLRVNF